MMRIRHALIATLLLAPILSMAQAAHLKFPDLTHLAGKASESVVIDLDPDTIATATGFLASAEGGDKDAAGLKDVLKGISSIHVRSFKFDTENVWSESDIAPLRRQIAEAGWKRIVSVQKQTETVDVAMRNNADDGGLVVLSARPKELTIVNIVGRIDLEKLHRLQGKLGVPNTLGATPSAGAHAQ